MNKHNGSFILAVILGASMFGIVNFRINPDFLPLLMFGLIIAIFVWAMTKKS